MTGSASQGGERQNYRREGTSWQYSGPIALAIWGDPVVGQALVLLLRSSGYEARFLPSSSLNEPGVLEDVRLLVLTPTPKLSTKQREASLASLSDVLETAKIPVLELTTLSEDPREGGARDESWYPVLWPCAIEKLEQQIEAALAEKSLG